MHSEIESALREAVECFRRELFAAASAMLGKASEGAWIELGRALLKTVPPGLAQSVSAQHKVLHDPRAGGALKIEAVMKLFSREELHQPIRAAIGISPAELREAAEWSHLVRDSRNSIHFDAKSVTPNNYEKVALLLLGVIPHFQTLYKIKTYAEKMSSESPTS